MSSCCSEVGAYLRYVVPIKFWRGREGFEMQARGESVGGMNGFFVFLSFFERMEFIYVH